MKNLLVVFFFVTHVIVAQKTENAFLVYPYLQDVTTNSVKILWETSFGEESVVEWGQTQRLGNKTSGTAFDVNFSESRIHEVELSGLKSLTEYYYRVKTGKITSETYQFKTAPISGSGQSFNIVAVSDMQRDSQNPEVFEEVINDGILEYFERNFGPGISGNLAMVLASGDLVPDGANYLQWQDMFFSPAKNLMTDVPFYPVLGNHENNSTYYFKYFSLPKNGTPSYAEHWWFKDYGNTRIIGLDSNIEYVSESQQLRWLQNLLNETAKDENIDFVFAQLHHPHKSELWIPGEADVTGKVIAALEKFTTETGKPTVHFFGHTHGYSRGQSKDHKHLWVNVASAGGGLDNWGEYEGRDYDEFTVTQDEYGFVVVEVDANKLDPKFTVKRISRGNQEKKRDNELRDSITVWKNVRKPEKPVALFPKDELVDSLRITLKAGVFKSSFKGAFHAASHWQVSKSKDFSELEMDSWKQFENWYYKENRQKEDDLEDEKTKRFKSNTTYYWRVRYRDQHLNWSEWSDIHSFTTKQLENN